MTSFEAAERVLIRRAVRVMSEIALDELYAEEVEGMYSPNVQFIASALEAVTSEMHRDTGITESFTEMELVRLEEIWTQLAAVLTVSGTPRRITSDNVILSDPELANLEAERDELTRKDTYIGARIDEITWRIVRSGEAKLKRSAR